MRNTGEDDFALDTTFALIEGFWETKASAAPSTSCEADFGTIC